MAYYTVNLSGCSAGGTPAVQQRPAWRCRWRRGCCGSEAVFCVACHGVGKRLAQNLKIVPCACKYAKLNQCMCKLNTGAFVKSAPVVVKHAASLPELF